jgi:hypothetical protein
MAWLCSLFVVQQWHGSACDQHQQQQEAWALLWQSWQAVWHKLSIAQLTVLLHVL